MKLRTLAPLLLAAMLAASAVATEPQRSGNVDSDFKVSPIPDNIFKIMQGKSYKAGCTIGRDELRLVSCLIKDKDGATHHGQMVVNRLIADRVCRIMRQLYDAGYPIERMRLIDHYNADDETSMSDNNSSAFNFRRVAGSRKLSAHSRGLAVDINPLYNPCRRTVGGKLVVQPATGRPYINRKAHFSYKITRGDLCHRLFTEAGFTWGGDWRTVKDYQHFEYTGRK